MKKTAAVLSVVFFAASALVLSAFAQIRPASVASPMPDFTLPVYQGGEVTLSELKGKNILLIFPRGLAGEDHWCHVCNYQYAELAEMEKNLGIREKYNLEILFVLPYSKDMVQNWVDRFPAQMEDIENWKNPADPDKLDERGRQRMERLRQYFPKKYMYEKGQVPLPFPILIDAERALSKGLGVFTTEWSGSKIEQNIPTIYIIDPEGVLQFKHISQNTFDRPGPDYLMNFVAYLNSKK